jgi:hypothetical protein
MIDAMNEEITGDCQWFLFCTETAVEYRQHPIFGDIAVCAKHTIRAFPSVQSRFESDES